MIRQPPDHSAELKARRRLAREEREVAQAVADQYPHTDDHGATDTVTSNK
jgi:hypothetical protein